ncbi:MAG TPA: MOP flippase family protein [Gaiellaceae bacterium]|nr:MOP flippase family protein [Gaiellaceae bacterium]
MGEDRLDTTQLSPLRRSVLSGVRWGTVSAGVIFALGLAQTAALAHLLDPKDFGLMAASLVVIGLARAFADLGLSSAIVAKQVRDEHVLSSLYWASLIAGFLVFLIVLALTPLFVSFYKQPELYHILPWAALSFVIIPIGQQFQMILQLEMRVDRLVQVDMLSAAVSLVVAVGAAVAGAGALALVIGYLARVGVTSLLFAMWGWKYARPGLRLRRADLDGYLGFGAYQMGERTANFLSANVDYLLVGRFLGVSALGSYSIAYQLVVKPVFELNPILTRVSFPAFARKQHDDEALSRGYIEVIRLIAFIVVPTMVAVAALAPVFVPVVFGSQWDSSIVLLQILSIVGVTRALTSPVGTLILAKGRADLAFKINAFLLVVMTVALFIAVHVNVVVVATASAVVNTLDFAFFLFVVTSLTGMRQTRYWSALRWTFANSAAAGVAMVGARMLLEPHFGESLLVFVAAAAAGVIAYLGLAFAYERRYILQMLSMLRPLRVAEPST